MRFISYAIIAVMCCALAGCGHRTQQSGPILGPPEPAATSTGAQSAEITPLVLSAVAVGGLAATAAVTLGSMGMLPTKIERGGVVGGGFLAVGALTLQRALPYIPWIVAALAIAGAVWALSHSRTIKRLLVKDRAKLCATTSKLASAVPISEIKADIDAHLASNKV